MSFKNLYKCPDCETLNGFRSIHPTEKDSTYLSNCVYCQKIQYMPYVKSIEKND